MISSHVLEIKTSRNFNGQAYNVSINTTINGQAITTPPKSLTTDVDESGNVNDTSPIDIDLADKANTVPRFTTNQKFTIEADVLDSTNANVASDKQDMVIPLPVVFVHGILTEVSPEGIIPHNMFDYLQSKHTLVDGKSAYTEDDTASPLLSEEYPTLVTFDYDSLHDLDDSIGASLAHYVLTSVLPATYADKVNLVSHSNGGIVSRWAITFSGLSGKVNTLIMIGSPTEGATGAAFAKSHFANLTALFKILSLLYGDGPYTELLKGLGEAQPYIALELLPTYPWFGTANVGLSVPTGYKNTLLTTLNAHGLDPTAHNWAITASGIGTQTYFIGKPIAWYSQVADVLKNGTQSPYAEPGDGSVPSRSQKATDLQGVSNWSSLQVIDNLGAVLHTDETKSLVTADDVNQILWQ